MTEGEREKQLLETVEQLKAELAELKKEKTQETTGGYGSYIRGAQFYANVPKDPFAHQYMMIHKPSKEIVHPSDLLCADILLSNVKDDRTMLLFQRDFYYLNRFFNMSKTSLAMKQVFNALYWPWVGQLRMTAAKSGGERSYQSFVEPEIESRGFGFMKKITGKKKQRRGIIDYMHPQEEQNIYE